MENIYVDLHGPSPTGEHLNNNHQTLQTFQMSVFAVTFKLPKGIKNV